ncbi:enoyl-CoA hydratase/isomerase family protein [Rhodococcoides fascians]|uniref:enoyl-CoA hydratase/isomerase family protein n=1 Tax=Rhodococcoides fascians TaxID=1828 RepID=UPI000AF070C6|nr:enoyl-CoA hydratase-related protein [Rhodococcus fascians]
MLLQRHNNEIPEARMSQNVVTTTVGAVATVRLDRPPVNAFDSALRVELGAAVRSLSEDEGVRAVVVTGGPSVFAAGADLKQLAAMEYEQISVWNRALQRVFNEIAALPLPVIAAVNGVALGGGMELALAADFRVLADDAVMALPEVQLGIVPGAGGMQRLRRLVGVSKAKEILMSGRRLDSSECSRLGIAEHVVPSEDVLVLAQDLAARFAAGPRFALQAIKESIDLGADSPLATGLAMDRNVLAGLFATGDRKIGIDSFFDHGLGKAQFGTTLE